VELTILWVTDCHQYSNPSKGEDEGKKELKAATLT